MRNISVGMPSSCTTVNVVTPADLPITLISESDNGITSATVGSATANLATLFAPTVMASPTLTSRSLSAAID